MIFIVLIQQTTSTTLFKTKYQYLFINYNDDPKMTCSFDYRMNGQWVDVRELVYGSYLYNLFGFKIRKVNLKI